MAAHARCPHTTSSLPQGARSCPGTGHAPCLHLLCSVRLSHLRPCPCSCPRLPAPGPPQKVVPSLIPGIVLGCLALLGFFIFLVWMFIGCCRCLLCCKCFRPDPKDDAGARDQFIAGGRSGPAAQVRLRGRAWRTGGAPRLNVAGRGLAARRQLACRRRLCPNHGCRLQACRRSGVSCCGLGPPALSELPACIGTIMAQPLVPQPPLFGPLACSTARPTLSRAAARAAASPGAPPFGRSLSVLPWLWWEVSGAGAPRPGSAPLQCHACACARCRACASSHRPHGPRLEPPMAYPCARRAACSVCLGHGILDHTDRHNCQRLLGLGG